MTSAPANLLAARRLLIDNLNIDPDTSRDDDLEPGEVGIVGDPAHRGGYHCGSDRVVTNDYSVVESNRDRTGLSNYASALDVGVFEVRSGGRTHNLHTFSTWCVAQCVANTPDSRDLREIIYSPDGKVVRRWDRLGRRSSGDDSHLYHTHFSYFRDSTKANRDQRPLFRRYLTTIGLLEDDDMTPEEHEWLKTVHRNLTVLDGRNPVGQIYTRMAMGQDHTDPTFKVPHPSLVGIGAQITAIQTAAAAAEAREAARDAAQDKMLQSILSAAGNPLSDQQFATLRAEMREVAEAAGAAATERISGQLDEQRQALAEAARAGAEALAVPQES